MSIFHDDTKVEELTANEDFPSHKLDVKLLRNNEPTFKNEKKINKINCSMPNVN